MLPSMITHSTAQKLNIFNIFLYFQTIIPTTNQQATQRVVSKKLKEDMAGFSCLPLCGLTSLFIFHPSTTQHITFSKIQLNVSISFPLLNTLNTSSLWFFTTPASTALQICIPCESIKLQTSRKESDSPFHKPQPNIIRYLETPSSTLYKNYKRML